MMIRILEFASPRVPRKGRDEDSPISDSTEVDLSTQVGTERRGRSSRTTRSQSQRTDANAMMPTTRTRSIDRIREKKVHQSPVPKYEATE
jgi:hypothetical protein